MTWNRFVSLLEVSLQSLGYDVQRGNQGVDTFVPNWSPEYPRFCIHFGDSKLGAVKGLIEHKLWLEVVIMVHVDVLQPSETFCCAPGSWNERNERK